MPTTVTLGKCALSFWLAYPLKREKTLARAPTLTQTKDYLGNLKETYMEKGEPPLAGESDY